MKNRDREPQLQIPLLSVVIANYNYGRYLEDAIQSVLSQIGEGANRVQAGEVELVVIDGGSTDDSIEIIKRHIDRLAYWVSEPDRGQSDAFNKGFAHTTGRFLTWLNADDIMLPGTIASLKDAALSSPRCEWFCGNFLRFNAYTGKVIEAVWGPHCVPRFLQGNHFPIATFGPTTFWSRVAYDRVGPLDISLHYTMDVDYWQRLIMSGYRYQRINHCCWAFRMHEASKTAEFDRHKRSEEVLACMKKELAFIAHKNGYSTTLYGIVLLRLWRALDFSALISIIRLYFVRGKKFKHQTKRS